MFADIHYKFKSNQVQKVRHQSSIDIPAQQKKFSVKWPFKVILGHVFWGQWKDDKGLNNTK